jgi:HK97 family phage major capsid protein
MNEIEKLKARLREIDAEQRKILDEADDKTAGVLSAEQRKQYDELQAEYEAGEKKLAELQADEERKRKLASREGRSDGDRRRGLRTRGRQLAPETAGDVRQVEDHAERDPARGFRTPREFLLAVMDATHAGRIEDRRLMPLAALAAGSDEQGEYSDPYGGFIVPEAFSPNLLTTMADADPMAGRVTQVPMTAPVVHINARVDKNHSSSVSGGLTVARREETGAPTSSRMAMEQVTLKADSLFGLAYATEELLSDSPVTFAALIQAGFAEEFAAKLIDERLNGTGVGEFSGVMNSPCLVSVAKEAGQSADTIVGANVLKMRKRSWRYSEAIWLANHDTYDQLAACHIAGTNGDVYLFSPARGEDVPDLLLGRPCIFTEWAKTLGDQGDLVLGTWSQFLEGTYQTLQSAESIHVRFLEHERTMKFWLRNAGAPWWRSALTPKNSTSTLSPFVVLDARA